MFIIRAAPITKAAARQRAGRAGRTQPGRCYRLYTEASYQNCTNETQIPGILEDNVVSEVLMLMSRGIKIPEFEFVDRLSPELYLRALEDLRDL